MEHVKYFPSHHTVQKSTVSLSFDEQPSQRTFVEHTHNKIELFLLLEGDVSMEAGGKIYPLRKNDLMILPQKVPHHLLVNRCAPYRRFIIHVDTEYLAGIGLSALTELASKKNPEIFDLTGTPFLQTLPACSAVAFTADEALQAAVLNERLLALYYALRAFQNVPPQSNADALIERAVEYVNANLENKLSIEGIAEQLYTSASYLCKIFRARMGIPLMHYVNRQRILRAKGLILDGTPLKEVYVRCGYDNYVTFFRVFRAQTGLSPSALANGE
jgi:AraC-like DNA-binding protein